MAENQQQALNSAVAYDAAAHLFWMIAEEYGVDKAAADVAETGGGCLLSLPYSVDLISQYQGFNELSDQEKSAFGQSVADIAYEAISGGGLLNGLIHPKDIEAGRSEGALRMDFGHLNTPPTTLEVEGEFETMGSLCIRHPLPAVVFSTEPPRTKSGVIRVADTRKALGFDAPLFMTNLACVQIDEAMYMLMGEFIIPAKDEISAMMWHHAIPNSTKIMTKIRFEGENFEGFVSPSWETPTIH